MFGMGISSSDKRKRICVTAGRETLEAKPWDGSSPQTAWIFGLTSATPQAPPHTGLFIYIDRVLRSLEFSWTDQHIQKREDIRK